MPLRALVASAAIVLTVSTALSAPLDDFVAACGLSGKTSPESCRCQAHLAQGSLTPPEMKVAIIGVRGDQAALRTALDRMGKARAQRFLDKMRSLAGKVATACS